MKLPDLHLFKRSFTSLVITPKKLQIVKMNSKHTTVEKFGQVEIPPGIIMNYRVKNKEALSVIIKDSWAKFKLRDRYVGVVVPEFSTYTKTLTLPNLTDIEINEALSWQLQEYLPMPLDEVVSDWKVIKRSKDEIQILVVAILKNVLFEYIDAVGEAGLFPLVVETPSLSIERITDGNNEAKLVIYVSDQEALLLLNEGEKIVASSVVTSKDINAVVNTAVQLLTHFNKVNVQKILIAGLGLTQDLVQFLHYNLGRPVQIVDIKVKGLLPAQAQDLLIAISLQKKDPAEPASEETINLLPPNWARHYKDKQTGIQAWSLTLIISIFVWANFLVVIIVFMLFGIQTEELQKSSEHAQSQELNQIATEVKNINALADRILILSLNTNAPQELINLLSQSLKEGIRIDSYSINYDSGTVKLSGLAVNRGALLEFKNSLEENRDFGEIEIPLSNLLKETDINFEFSLVYVPLTSTKPSQPVKLKL